MNECLTKFLLVSFIFAFSNSALGEPAQITWEDLSPIKGQEFKINLGDNADIIGMNHSRAML